MEMEHSLVQHEIEVKPSIARGPSLPAFIALSSTAAEPQDKHHKQAYEQPVTSTPVHGHYSRLITAALHKSVALPSKPSKQDIQLWWRWFTLQPLLPVIYPGWSRSGVLELQSDPEEPESLPHAQIILILLCCCHRCVSGFLKCWPSCAPETYSLLTVTWVSLNSSWNNLIRSGDVWISVKMGVYLQYKEGVTW